MFLSSSSSVVKENYHAPPIGNEEQQNLSVCIGTFSGANSSYNMYKSNCFDLMVQSCSTKWTPECDAYIANSSNTKQTELFLNTVASYGKQPVSSTNSCNVYGHSHNANQRIVMGMNTFQTDDDTYVPLSCYQSTFFEQKKRSLIKKQEYEERKRAQRMEHELQFKKQLQLERVRIDKEEQSSKPADVSTSINSTTIISSDVSPDESTNSTSPVTSEVSPISSEVSTSSSSPETVSNPTIQKKSFYDSITDVGTASCSKTCEISKMM
jgi:hypothetical protein